MDFGHRFASEYVVLKINDILLVSVAYQSGYDILTAASHVKEWAMAQSVALQCTSFSNTRSC